MVSRPGLILSCEHGGNAVPRRYQSLFRGAGRVLSGHRGYDQGALELARALSRQLNVPLTSATVTRLVVDLNRSIHHRRLFSDFTARLSAAQKQHLLAEHYHPYRNEVEQRVRTARCPVLHLSLHSFTPELNGAIRNADIGLLYDPRRKWERAIAKQLRGVLHRHLPRLRVRMNYPYRGVADGLTTALRRAFGDRRYAGIEFELNQRLVARRDWAPLRRQLAAALAIALH